jgi:hypothetical protein
MKQSKQTKKGKYVPTIDDWFDEHGEQVIYEAAIKAGFDSDSINDWLDKRHTF